MSLFILRHIYIPERAVSSPWLSISEGYIFSTRQGLHLRVTRFRNGSLLSFPRVLQHIAYISTLHEALQSSESNTSLRFTVCKPPSPRDSVGGFGTNQGNPTLWAHLNTWPFRVLHWVHELSASSVFVPLTLR